MIIVYDAANSLEGHMIKDMLEQQGIPAYVQGEHLQSGIGELPAISSLVKVSVDNEHYEEAKSIIHEWQNSEEISQPLLDNTLPEKQIKTDSFNFFQTSLAFILGAICMHLYLTPATTHSNYDHNNDGINDEIWTYENDVAVKSEFDRNFDGKIDDIWFYKDGLSLKNMTDENFDGKFDTEYLYEKGIIYYSKSDIDNDGEIDFFTDFELNNARYKTSIIDPQSGLIKKIQTYKMNKLIAAEFDSNNDGKLDTKINYDIFEEEINRSRLP